MRMISAFPAPVAAPREIYIMAGESDMSGRGLLSEMPDLPSNGRVQVFSNDWLWRVAAEPIDDPSGQIDAVSIDGSAGAIRGISPGASCGMSFATALASMRLGNEIALVPCARGGSKISEWSRSLSRSTLYGSMIARAQAASSAGVIRGVLWFQGKNDANDMAAANSWDASCYQLIDNIRADLAIPDLPIIITALGNSTGVPDSAYWATIRAKQLNMGGEKIAVVDTLDLPQKPDDLVHIATSGLIALGQRYATAMQAMIQ